MPYRSLLLFLGLLIGCDKPEQFARVGENLAEVIRRNSCVGDSCIAIISHSTLDAKYLSLTLDNHQQYARKHRYDYIFRNNLLTTSFIDELSNDKKFQLGLYWQKIAALQDAMNEKVDGKRKYDWVLWIDADAVFTNFDMKLEDLIVEHAESVASPKNYFMASTDGFSLINAGVLLFYNDERSHRMIQTIFDAFPWYKSQTLPEQDLIQDYIAGYLTQSSAGKFQITPIMSRNYKDKNLLIPGTKVLSQRVLNSFYGGWWPWTCREDQIWQPGDLISHFALVKDKNKDISHLVKCFQEKGGANYSDGTEYKSCS